MAISSDAVRIRSRAPLRTERSVRADLEDLEEFRARYDFLDIEEIRLGEELDQAKAELDEVRKNDVPALQRLQAVSGAASTKRRESINGLEAKIKAAEDKVETLQESLSAVQAEKKPLEGFETDYEAKRKRFESELTRMKAKKPDSRVEPVPVVAAVATPAPAAEPSAAPKAKASKSEEEELDALGYTPFFIAKLDAKDRERIIRDEFRYADYRKAHPELVTTPKAERPEAKATATAKSGGFPGWLLFILGVVVVALLLWMIQPWTWFATPGQVTPASTAAPTVQAMGAAPAISNMRSNPIDRNQRRYEIETSVPTTVRLIDINADKVMAESGTPAKSHSLVFTVPEFSGLEKTFRLKLEAKGADGQLVVFGPIEVTVLRNSRAAGGIADTRELVAYLKESQSGADRDALVSLIKSLAPNYPGVSGLTAGNLVSFVEANLSKFEVRNLTAPLTGEFAYVRADGSSGYSPVTLAAGTPVLTFDGKVLASALCVNEVRIPIPPVTTVPTPTPTPRGGFRIIKFWDLNGNGVRDPGEPGLANVRFNINSGLMTSCTTGSDGTGGCSFSGMIPGTTVTLTEMVPDGWVATTATVRTITIAAGQTQTLWFGNRQVTSVTTTPAPTPVQTPTMTATPRPALAINILVGPFRHTPTTSVQSTIVTASVTGGDGNYAYNWVTSSNARVVSGQGTNQATVEVTGCDNLAITVTVTSGGSSVSKSTGQIKPGNCPDTVLTVRVSQGSWSAYNSATNSYQTTITATASGGARPIRWQDGSQGDTFSSTITVTAGQSASGTVTATDNFGVIVSQSWTATAPSAPPTASAPRVNITATKAATATGCTYTLTASTESGSFSYSWSNGSTGSTTTVNLNFGQSGSATVTVQDTTSPSRPAGTANWQDVCGSSGY